MKDCSQDLGRVVSEMYNPPRVTAAAKLLPSPTRIPRFALQLTTMDRFGRPWVFDKPEHRRQVFSMVEERKVALLMKSHVHSLFGVVADQHAPARSGFGVQQVSVCAYSSHCLLLAVHCTIK